MIDRIASLIPLNPTAQSAAIVGALLLAWVAAVYLVMAGGVRSGELVWSGRHISRLPAEQRWWSLIYALALIGSGLALLEITDAIGTDLIPEHWLVSAGASVACFLGVAAVLNLLRGSAWERMFFFPITLFGAWLAGWLVYV